MSLSNSSHANQFLKHTILVGLVCLAITATGTQSLAAAGSCSLDPIDYPGNSFFSAISAISAENVSQPDLPLLGAQVYFTKPRTDPAFEHPVVDVFLMMTFDASKIRDSWTSEVTQRLTDVGCSSQTVHSFRAPVSDGVMHGYFHVRYNKRWCWGGMSGDTLRVETDVWQDFRFEIAPDRKHITLSMSGHASDNVSQLAKDVAKVIGNIFSIVPLTGSLVLGFDKQVFEGLKAERDALDAASRYRVISSKAVGLAGPQVDFLLQDAHFEDNGGSPAAKMLSVQQNYSRTQACTLRDKLASQLLQANNVGVATEYTVKPGDSLWRIAKQTYGDAQYYWLIAGLNAIGDNELDRLRAGQTIKLESLGAALRGGEYVVVPKDSMWTISERQKSSGVSFAALIQKNRGAVTDPDRIYPLEIIRH